MRSNIKNGSSKVGIIITVGVMCFVLLIVFAVASSAAGMIQVRDPALNTLGGAGDISCQSWSTAKYPQYQTIITAAANKFKIAPAVLGGIFLSENGEAWPDHDISGPWDDTSDIIGPFQFTTETWNGLIGGQSTFKGYSRSDFTQSAEVAAFHLQGLFKTYGWNAQAPEENQLRCVAAGYNKGGAVCKKWKEEQNFVGNPEGVDINGAGLGYDVRTWNHYNDLNVGCTSASSGSSKIVQIATEEKTGFSQTSSAYWRGENSVKYNNFAGKAWCASFATWVINHAGYSIGTHDSADGMMKYFSESQLIIPNETTPLTLANIQPGDIVFYKGSGEPEDINKTISHHVAIVIAPPMSGFVPVIAGNTSHDDVRDYDDVYKLNTILAVGRMK